MLTKRISFVFICLLNANVIVSVSNGCLDVCLCLCLNYHPHPIQLISFFFLNIIFNSNLRFQLLCTLLWQCCLLVSIRVECRVVRADMSCRAETVIIDWVESGTVEYVFSRFSLLFSWQLMHPSLWLGYSLFFKKIIIHGAIGTIGECVMVVQLALA